jgi:hypothetical protein
MPNPGAEPPEEALPDGFQSRNSRYLSLRRSAVKFATIHAAICNSQMFRPLAVRFHVLAASGIGDAGRLDGRGHPSGLNLFISSARAPVQVRHVWSSRSSLATTSPLKTETTIVGAHANRAAIPAGSTRPAHGSKKAR